MFWVIVGVMLAVGWALVWYVALVGADEDARSVREWERQRRECERWFK